MKTLIVYASVHHQNTEKVAKVIAAELGADLMLAAKAHSDTVTTYDLIGFGSGIYFFKFHKTLLQFITGLSTAAGKQAFVFSTSGDGGTNKGQPNEEDLEEARVFARGLKGKYT
jgi:flavodoxin